MTTSIQEQKMAKAHNIIAKGDRLTKIDNMTYEVPSQSGNWFYRVNWSRGEWHCDCPDHNKREANCKHIFATMMWVGLHDTTKDVDEHKPLKFTPCPKCGSYDAVKNGRKKTEKGLKQRFVCKDCGTSFMLKELGFESMKFSPEVVTQCLDLYFKGVSLRKIAHHIGQTHNGLEISHVMIYYWIKRYAKIIGDYVDTLNPEVGDVWSADEMTIKVKHDGITWRRERKDKYCTKAKWVWMWNVLDNETRFLLATAVTKKKNVKDARKVFKMAKDVAGTKPKCVTTDGLGIYHKAFNKEFYTNTLPRTKHISEVGIADRINNNRVERFHGSVRQREKVMRGMQNPRTSQDLLESFRAYYNFARPHMALDGKTPAEVAGLDLNLGNNKLLGLIKQAVSTPHLTVSEYQHQI